jgi:hypothetical protein
VFPITEQALDFIRHVVVEQKPHCRTSLICSAMSASIGVR